MKVHQGSSQPTGVQLFCHQFHVVGEGKTVTVSCDIADDYPVTTDWPERYPRTFGSCTLPIYLSSPTTASFPIEPAETGDLTEALISVVAPALLVATREIVCFHGGVVRLGDSTAIILGSSGTGKSTLSQFLHLQGYGFAGDNILGVKVRHGLPELLPGHGFVKLLPDAAHWLGSPWDDLAPWNPDPRKRVLFLDDSLILNHKLVPSLLYFLTPGDSPSATPMSPIETVMALTQHTFSLGFLGILDPKRHFETVSALARTCKAYTLCRGSSFDQLPEVARILEEHAGLSGPPNPSSR